MDNIYIHERTFAALHEAGHAVCYCRLGIDQERVSIQQGDGMDGYTIVPAYVGDPLTALKQVLGQLAGYAALIGAGYGCAVACQGADTDFNNAAELITTWELPGTLEEWKAVTVELMSKPKNIAAVELVSEALLDHETLAGDYIGGLIERADGLPEHLWRRWVELEYPDML